MALIAPADMASRCAYDGGEWQRNERAGPEVERVTTWPPVGDGGLAMCIALDSTMSALTASVDCDEFIASKFRLGSSTPAVPQGNGSLESVISPI